MRMRRPHLAVLLLVYEGETRLGELAGNLLDGVERLAGLLQFTADLFGAFDEGVDQRAERIRLVGRFRQIPAAAETFRGLGKIQFPRDRGEEAVEEAELAF